MKRWVEFETARSGNRQSIDSRFIVGVFEAGGSDTCMIEYGHGWEIEVKGTLAEVKAKIDAAEKG